MKASILLTYRFWQAAVEKTRAAEIAAARAAEIAEAVAKAVGDERAAAAKKASAQKVLSQILDGKFHHARRAVGWLYGASVGLMLIGFQVGHV